MCVFVGFAFMEPAFHIIVGERFPTQVMRDYLPVSDPLSIFAPQTPVYLLCAIGSLRYNK